MLGSSRSRIAVGGITLALGALFGMPALASASVSQCTSTHGCIWGENSYSGCFYQNGGNVPDYTKVDWTDTCSTGVKINDGADSVKDNGSNASCYLVFYANSGYGGDAIKFSPAVSGSNYEDPNLSNGAGLNYAPSGGTSQKENWSNRISSDKFIC